MSNLFSASITVSSTIFNIIVTILTQMLLTSKRQLMRKNNNLDVFWFLQAVNYDNGQHITLLFAISLEVLVKAPNYIRKVVYYVSVYPAWTFSCYMIQFIEAAKKATMKGNLIMIQWKEKFQFLREFLSQSIENFVPKLQLALKPLCTQLAPNEWISQFF